MNDLAVRMWQQAGSAYRHQSRDASFQLGDADDELDDLASSLVSEGIAEDVDPQVTADLALVARFYERLGDHAVNLARRVDTMAAPRRLTLAKRLTPRRLFAAPAPDAKQGPIRRVLLKLNRFRLAPTDEAFFTMFEAAAENVRDCADQLRKLIAASDEELDEHFEEIKTYERQGDQITRDLLMHLDTSFVTPYDREDIHALAEELDDVVDDMFAAASLIHVVRVDQSLAESAELADVLVAMTDELVALVSGMRGRDGARYRLERIEHLERQGDAVFRHGMGRLFSGEYEPIEVIKWKDIIEALEASLNAIEDVSDVVESILVKNA
jgi:predicted phosphate transport protein (TIGR00153 family)